MPFCPKCRYEYESSVAICSDCDERLVAELPKIDLGEEYKDWVPLARLTSNVTAEMVAEALREKQIPAVILSAAGYFGVTGQMGPSSFQPAGEGYLLAVPLEFIELADTEAEGILGDEWQNAKLVDWR